MKTNSPPAAFICKKVIISIAIMVLLPIISFAQVKPNKEHTQNFVVKYVKSNSLEVKASQSEESTIVGTLKFANKVLVLKDSASQTQVKTIYPFKGYVNSKALYSEKEADDLYNYKTWEIKELNLIISGYTPYNDLVKNKLKKTSQINLSRRWKKDNVHRVKIVAASKLNLRKLPTTESDSLTTFVWNEEIIVDNTYKEEDKWSKVVFPRPGYVYKEYLYSRRAMNRRKKRETEKLAKIKKSVLQTSVIELDKKKYIKTYQKQDSSQNTEIITENGNTYVVLNNKAEINNDSVKIWWTKKHDFNKNGYSSQPVLNVQINSEEKSKQKYRARIYSRERKEKDYQQLYTSKRFKPNKPLSVEISEEQGISKKGRYNFRVDIFDDKSSLFVSGHQYDKKELDRNKFETLVEDTIGADTTIRMHKHEISVMGTYSPVMLPIEKNFNQHKEQWGANIEYSKPDWKLSIGLGYNRIQARSESKAYLLKTNTTCLYGKYTPIELFNNKLKLFMLGGVTFWNSSFQNIIHPELPEYYPEEKANGLNFLVGAGTAFYYRNFFIGTQFVFYNSPKVSFGKDPIDPTNITELQEYEPTTKYQLSTGSNQLQIVLGYQFIF